MLVGYSLDNLSLMALTIAVGFVVDDAIVMLENIFRHVEDGMTPMEAALKGAGEIGFTIISISLSLVAVFIPLLLMGGIVGRLFREFAVTVTMTIVVSALVSLTLTPMMASRFLKPTSEVQHGRLYVISERGFDAHAARLRARARRRAAHQLRHALRVLRHGRARRVICSSIIPKGFFPQQDTGLITGISEAAQDISFAEMCAQQQALGEIVLQDPAVATVGHGSAAAGNALNNGRLFITLKPRDERDASADEVIARLRPKLDKVAGRAAVPAGGAGHQRRRPRRRARSTSTRCRTPTSTSSTSGRRSARQAARRCRSCATSPPTSRPAARR